MSFKIDTKEKFTVITPISERFDANIAALLWETATLRLDQEPGNVIVNLENVSNAETQAINTLASLQQHFHAAKRSFVICQVQPAVLDIIKNEDLTDTLNVTPTESEAWDVVQMEEIERELTDDFEKEEDELNP